MAGAPLKETSLELAGRRVPVRLYRNNRARRVILRIDDHGDDGDVVVVTLPRGASQAEGLALVVDKAGWVLERLDGLPPRVPFADGQSLPLGGIEHLIRHVPQIRGGVWREGAKIFVCGRPEHVSRRIRDWLKGQAREQIAPRVRDKAATLGQRAGRISIRDTKSRWGSCSQDGNLSFCWRLVMAPITILDYVVAHEVAHMIELHHGPRFWRTVKGLTEDMDEAREWLSENGEKLYRYG